MNLRQFIEGYVKLTDTDWQLIEALFQRKEFKKNELILEDGKVCKHF